MKQLLIAFLLGFIALTTVNAQTSYDPVNAEVISNRLNGNITLTKQQASQAVNYAIIGLSKSKAGGERLLDAYPAGTEWRTFHRAYESIEEEYDAAYVIIKNIDKFKKLLTETQFAKLSVAIREYKDWYSHFCIKQRVYTGSPY